MQSIHGVCYHPVYGGWVSLDGVFIFKDVLCPDLEQKVPKDLFPHRKERIELLEKYNTPPYLFRDLIPVPRKFAEEHQKYFSSNLDQKIAIAKRIGRWEDGMHCYLFFISKINLHEIRLGKEKHMLTNYFSCYKLNKTSTPFPRREKFSQTERLSNFLCN